MSSVQEMQRVDWELFLELIESLVSPTFLHMSNPLQEYDPMFYHQINGEALWQWRVIKTQKQIFEVPQDNFLQLGYRLSPSCKDCVGVQSELPYKEGPKPYKQLKLSCIEIKLLV